MEKSLADLEEDQITKNTGNKPVAVKKDKNGLEIKKEEKEPEDEIFVEKFKEIKIQTDEILVTEQEIQTEPVEFENKDTKKVPKNKKNSTKTVPIVPPSFPSVPSILIRNPINSQSEISPIKLHITNNNPPSEPQKDISVSEESEGSPKSTYNLGSYKSSIKLTQTQEFNKELLEKNLEPIKEAYKESKPLKIDFSKTKKTLGNKTKSNIDSSTKRSSTTNPSPSNSAQQIIKLTQAKPDIKPSKNPSLHSPLNIDPAFLKKTEEIIDTRNTDIQKILKSYLGDDPNIYQIVKEIVELLKKNLLGEQFYVNQKVKTSGKNTPKIANVDPLNPILKKSNENTEDLHDHEMIHMDNPKTDLPRKLLAAMSSMSDSLTSLQKDEYGEWLLDITKDSDLVQRILKNGHLLTLLLRNLYRPKKGTIDKNGTGFLYDMGIQTEEILSVDYLKSQLKDGEIIFNGKICKEKFVQTAISQARDDTPCGPGISSSYIYDEKKQLGSMPLTVIKPFVLGKLKRMQKIINHPGHHFITLFREKFGISCIFSSLS